MSNLFFKLGICAFLAPMIASATPDIKENIQLAYAHDIPKTYHSDPVDGGWLPDLTGLPDKDQVLNLKNHAAEVMKHETQARCNAIPKSLRLMVFRHFLIRQQLANAQNIYFDDQTAQQWAHMLGMILKESSGDTASITDMTGKSMSTFSYQTDLDHWRKILSLSEKTGRIHLNAQTNFGLTQTSADRLFVAFKLAKPQKFATAYLEGKQGALSDDKHLSNTAIAARRLVWFYQDFAQGRTTQENERIDQSEMMKPENAAKKEESVDLALVYCGSRYVFDSGLKHPEKLKNALSSIAYCKLGNSKSGYGKNQFDEKCFAEWVTLCPALNLDIAFLTPMSYFETRNEKPVCENTFKNLINKKPGS
ncbi:MAG: hypothetical protein H0U57_14380 [Tatlockia sp.]|nr:hypothetical protein [Tatlockia sp.]